MKFIVLFCTGLLLGVSIFYFLLAPPIWYDGFYQFCIHAPSQAGVHNSLPMYYENECRDMLDQAKQIDLYHNLIIPTQTPPLGPQG